MHSQKLPKPKVNFGYPRIKLELHRFRKLIMPPDLLIDKKTNFTEIILAMFSNGLLFLKNKLRVNSGCTVRLEGAYFIKACKPRQDSIAG